MSWIQQVVNITLWRPLRHTTTVSIVFCSEWTNADLKLEELTTSSTRQSHRSESTSSSYVPIIPYYCCVPAHLLNKAEEGGRSRTPYRTRMVPCLSGKSLFVLSLFALFCCSEETTSSRFFLITREEEQKILSSFCLGYYIWLAIKIHAGVRDLIRY